MLITPWTGFGGGAYLAASDGSYIRSADVTLKGGAAGEGFNSSFDGGVGPVAVMVEGALLWRANLRWLSCTCVHVWFLR